MHGKRTFTKISKKKSDGKTIKKHMWVKKMLIRNRQLFCKKKKQTWGNQNDEYLKLKELLIFACVNKKKIKEKY